MKGCVGAIDGRIIKTRRPSLTENRRARAFWCFRKNCYGVNLQATCDADGKNLDADVSNTAKDSDSISHRVSDLGVDIRNDEMPEGWYLVGDAAYVQGKHMMTPVPGLAANMGVWADSYNFQQSSIRMNIERALGMLIRRWGILWRPLEFHHDKWAPVIMCVMRLHNLCMDHHVGLSEGLATDGCVRRRGAMVQSRPRIDRDGRPVDFLTDDRHRYAPDDELMRNHIIEAVKDAGITRPA